MSKQKNPLTREQKALRRKRQLAARYHEQKQRNAEALLNNEPTAETSHLLEQRKEIQNGKTDEQET